MADGRADWQGYFWRNVKLDVCPDFGSAAPCRFFHGKWDWKRNQWVDLFFTSNASTLQVEQVLTNYDRADDDYVCTVVILEDAAQRNLVVFHFNEHSTHQTASTASARFSIPLQDLSQVTSMSVGTKQCREGGSQDRDVFARVMSRLSTR